MNRGIEMTEQELLTKEIQYQEYLNYNLTQLHWLYSPYIFKDSVVSFEKMQQLYNLHKHPIIILDRNIFSRIIKIASCGYTSEGNTIDIAFLIVWATRNNIDISSYFALNEYAECKNSENEAQLEYQIWDRIFSTIPFIEWEKIALRQTDHIETTINISNSQESSIAFLHKSDDYLTNYAAMLHLGYILREYNNPIEQFKHYFDWLFHNLKLSRYTILYACRLFLGSDNYKSIKNIHGNNYDKAVKGCQNQARDLVYLTLLSVDRFPSNYEPILVSDDKMLGDLFVNGYFNTNPIRMFENQIKTHKSQISLWVSELIKNHVEVNTENYHSYCIEIVNQEEKRLAATFNV